MTMPVVAEAVLVGVVCRSSMMILKGFWDDAFKRVLTLS
jgi:hypothetical protein